MSSHQSGTLRAPIQREKVGEQHEAGFAEESQGTYVFPDETLASLRVLLYLAEVDGPLSPEARDVLRSTLDAAGIPPSVPIQKLVVGPIVLDDELRRIVSTEGKERTFNAAYGLTFMDGRPSAHCRKVFDRIRLGLGIPEQKASLLGRMWWETREAILPSTLTPITDPAKREQQVHEDIRKYSVFAAVAGAFPLPFISILMDLSIVSMQVQLVRNLGRYWGHVLDRQAAHSLVGAIAGASGMRIAVHAVLTTTPVLGSAVGAATAFATTWALGRAAQKYFESGGQLDRQALRELYAQFSVEAREAYAKCRDLILTTSKSREAAIRQLNADHEAGKISSAQYEKKLGDLTK